MVVDRVGFTTGSRWHHGWIWGNIYIGKSICFSLDAHVPLKPPFFISFCCFLPNHKHKPIHSPSNILVWFRKCRKSAEKVLATFQISSALLFGYTHLFLIIKYILTSPVWKSNSPLFAKQRALNTAKVVEARNPLNRTCLTTWRRLQSKLSEQHMMPHIYI